MADGSSILLRRSCPKQHEASWPGQVMAIISLRHALRRRVPMERNSTRNEGRGASECRAALPGYIALLGRITRNVGTRIIAQSSAAQARWRQYRPWGTTKRWLAIIDRVRSVLKLFDAAHSSEAAPGRGADRVLLNAKTFAAAAPPGARLA